MDEKINYYVINLSSKRDRWTSVQEAFSAIGISPERIAAVSISPEDDWPGEPRFYPGIYYMLLGEHATPARVGCYASHMETWRRFLESDADYAVICEDDIIPDADFVSVIHQALRFGHTWDNLRLFYDCASGCIPYASLAGGRQLCTMMKGFRSNAAYVLNRRGAENLRKQLQAMVSACDLTVLRGRYGVREACVSPFPVRPSPLALESSITSPEKPPKTYPWHPVWWTKRFYRIYLRAFRYSFQGSRAVRRWLFPPIPHRE